MTAGEYKVGDVVVVKHWFGMKDLIQAYHEDRITHIHDDHVHIECIDDTDDTFAVPTDQFESDWVPVAP